MSAIPHVYRQRQLTQEAALARRRRRPAEHGAAGPGPRAVLDDADLHPRRTDNSERILQALDDEDDRGTSVAPE